MESEIVESFNDDDWYIMDKKTKKVVKHLGKFLVPYGTDPTQDRRIKPELTSPTYVVMKGMKAKWFGKSVTENADHEALFKLAQKGHLRALKKGNAALANHYARRMAFHTRHLVK